MKKIWCNWPINYGTYNLKAWHEIARGVVFLPLVIIAFALLYFSVCLMTGNAEAERIRKDVQ
jgi:hypothetical protein